MKFAARNTAALVVAFLFSAAAQGADPNLCAACHGEGGNSANPAVPSLAQQPAQFISTSLFMFREGNRKDPQMSPMAEKLSNAEMNELAAYFSKQKAAAPKHKSKPENAAAGPGLAKKFNCSQCHGPQLLGQRVRPADVEGWFTDLGLTPTERADRDGIAAWDLVLDGRRRFDLRDRKSVV